MSRTIRVKNKNERKHLIGHNFWKVESNQYYRIGKYDYWRTHIQEARSKLNVFQEYKREDDTIKRGYDYEVCKSGNYSNKSCREFANLGRAKMRDQLRLVTLENDIDIIDDRKYRTCAYRWFILW